MLSTYALLHYNQEPIFLQTDVGSENAQVSHIPQVDEVENYPNNFEHDPVTLTLLTLTLTTLTLESRLEIEMLP